MRVWLKKLREEKNMSMQSIAKKLEISESYYCMIENGVRQEKMDLTLAAKLSVILEIPLTKILSNEQNEAGKGGGTE